MPIDLIHKYFPDLDEAQYEKMKMLGDLYSYWNDRINLVSRKDMENIYERHVLHSLAIAKVFHFQPGLKILDAGTGGGFPGIPLAILFPGCHFNLVDSTAKKLKAVDEVARALGLQNVSVNHERLENLPGRYDFVVSRALASLPQTVEWVWKNISPVSVSDNKSGLIYLKGGEFEDELEKIDHPFKIFHISDFYEEEYFQTKKIVYTWKEPR